MKKIKWILIYSFRNILTSLLQHSDSVSLMVGQSSCFVIQKLIHVLPSSDLTPLHDAIMLNFLRLSQDKIGCRVVQYYIEHSSEAHQMELCSVLCKKPTLMSLVCDSHGTYVAQVSFESCIKSPCKFNFNTFRHSYLIAANLRIS